MGKITAVLILVFLVLFAQAQETGKLVVISLKVGEEISRLERDQYGLFPEVGNFISARFYRMPDNSYRAEISYFGDNEVRREIRVISNEEFDRHYRSKFTDVFVSVPRAAVDLDKRLVRLHLTDKRQPTGYIDSLKNDIVYFHSVEPEANNLKISVSEIEEFSVVRTSNVAAGFGIGAVPGALAALLVYAASENEEDVPPFAEGRATRFHFIAGEVVGLSIGGTISILRGMDYDFPLDGKSADQKIEAISNIQRFRVRMKTHLRFGPWFGIYQSPSNLNDYAYLPGVRLSLAHSPRTRMEIMYGYTEIFGKTHTRDYYDYPYEGIAELRSKKLHLQVLRAGFRADFTRRQTWNPFIGWGWGFIQKFYENDDEDTDLLISLDFGVEHHVRNYFSIESRIGLVENIDNGLEILFQVGLHLGKHY